LISNLLIKVAKGELPADLILANARIVNVFTGEIESGNVAIYEGKIAGVGDYHQAKLVLDLTGKYIAPGFINGHTHLESSMLDISQYARAVVPRGTLALVTDLHEIARGHEVCAELCPPLTSGAFFNGSFLCASYPS